MNHQQVFDIPQICSEHGVRWAVISPGSRSAILSVAFERHPEIETIVVLDERSAGFLAHGLAQSTDTPVALVCTSGSAVLNYAPAVSEAYFSESPLLVFSADRPEEWIDQWDGQTIHQQNVLSNHVKKSFHLPSNTSDKDSRWYFERSINDSIITANKIPKGPVHINIPIKEPFYPSLSSINFGSPKIISDIDLNTTVEEVPHDLIETWNNAKEILLVPGQMNLKQAKQLQNALEKHQNITVIADQISNLKFPKAISFHDWFLKMVDHTEFPEVDLLITADKSIISKALKLFLRNIKISETWHFSHRESIYDSYQHLTKKFNSKIHDVLNLLPPKLNESKIYTDFNHHDRLVSEHLNLNSHLKGMSEMAVVSKLTSTIDDSLNLHLSNSMPVRLYNYLPRKDSIEVFANRGTSGIDGCTSTAIGHSFADSNKMNLLITGDLSFYYDSHYLNTLFYPKNIKIVILDNGGGGIFGQIKGPTELPEYKKLFFTPQSYSIEKLADSFGRTFSHIIDQNQLNEISNTSINSWPDIIQVDCEKIQLNEAVIEFLASLSDS